MTLEIKIYKEITATEAKVMWGMSWRQLAAAAAMAVLSAGVWLLFRMVLGMPELGQYAVLLADMPVAAWGWLRPKGLKPETWLGYVLRQRFGQRRYWLDGPAARRERRRHGIGERKGRR